MPKNPPICVDTLSTRASICQAWSKCDTFSAAPRLTPGGSSLSYLNLTQSDRIRVGEGVSTSILCRAVLWAWYAKLADLADGVVFFCFEVMFRRRQSPLDDRRYRFSVVSLLVTLFSIINIDLIRRTRWTRSERGSLLLRLGFPLIGGRFLRSKWSFETKLWVFITILLKKRFEHCLARTAEQ